jgi:hypothetical protein
VYAEWLHRRPPLLLPARRLGGGLGRRPWPARERSRLLQRRAWARRRHGNPHAPLQQPCGRVPRASHSRFSHGRVPRASHPRCKGTRRCQWDGNFWQAKQVSRTFITHTRARAHGSGRLQRLRNSSWKRCRKSSSNFWRHCQNGRTTYACLCHLVLRERKGGGR